MAKSEAQTMPADVDVSGGNADTSQAQAQAPKDVPPENMPAADYIPSADEANKDDG